MTSKSAVFMYHFFISSEGRSNFSRLHKLNSEMRGIVATTLTAQLSSLVTAVSVDGHSLRPDAQVSSDRLHATISKVLDSHSLWMTFWTEHSMCLDNRF